jgi:hypothetical protein
MKLILSRKGFDSVYGRIPNVIPPDGRLRWFPIPSEHGKVRYRDLSSDRPHLEELLDDLSNGEIIGSDRCHLDPDVTASYVPRPKSWRPCFGQTDVAQSHLCGQGVGPGDLFLFFGWFREAAMDNRRWKFVSSAQNLHVFFGWLQVGEAYSVETDLARIPKFAKDHPHVMDHARFYGPQSNNAAYVAGESLNLPGIGKRIPGGGSFPRFNESLRLTAEGGTRGLWLLPKWFFPSSGRPALTYHSDPSRWEKTKDGVLLRTVGRGQEFVLDLDHYPEAIGWVRRLFAV